MYCGEALRSLFPSPKNIYTPDLYGSLAAHSSLYPNGKFSEFLWQNTCGAKGFWWTWCVPQELATTVWLHVLGRRNTLRKYNKRNFSLAASFWGICLLSAFVILRWLKLASISVFHTYKTERWRLVNQGVFRTVDAKFTVILQDDVQSVTVLLGGISPGVLFRVESAQSDFLQTSMNIMVVFYPCNSKSYETAVTRAIK